MAKLFPHLPFMPDETPLSWAGRLAAFHTFGPLVPFLNDLSIPLTDLAGGVNGSVERLCEITGQDAAPVLHNTLRRQGDRRFSLRGEVFSAEFLTGPTAQLCPACLAEDQAANDRPHVAHRYRLAWMFRTVRTCPQHGIALVERRQGRWDDFARELGALVPEAGEDLAAIADAQSRRAPSSLQDYVLARLTGRRGPDWLDGQDLDQAVKASEMLGAVLEFGAAAGASDLDANGWDQAGRAAYPYVREGVSGIRSALAEIGTARQAETSEVLLRPGDFGMLHSWLNASKLSKDPGPIRELLRDHIVETTDVMAGSKVLGKSVVVPRWSSISSLARSEHVHPLTLRKVLIAREIVPPIAETRPCSATLVNYKEGRDLAAAMKRAVPFTALPQVLHASRPVVQVLIDSGLLPTLRERGPKYGKTSCAVDRNHVEALVRRLWKLAPPVDVAPSGMHDLAKSAEMSRVSLVAILPAIFRGHLTRVNRLKSKMGFHAIIVDPAEIQEKEFEFQPGISMDMACGIIGVEIDVLRNLMSDQMCPALMSSTRVFGQHEPCIEPECLQAFIERWATIAMLRRETGLNPERICDLLSDAKVKPAFDPKRVGTEVYRRSEISDVVLLS